MKLRAFIFLAALLELCLPAHAQVTQLGDKLLGSEIHCPWGTFDKSGNSATPATAGTLYVYKDSSTAVVKAVVADLSGTDTRAFDGNAGDHEAKFLTTNAFFAAGSDYEVRLRSAVVDGQTVNRSVCAFSLENGAETKGRIRARGNMVSSSTAQVIQLASTAFTQSHTWQGLLFCDLVTQECAGICDSADGGAGNDTLNLSGLITVPGATDAFIILWQTVPLSCINSPPGSGLPLITSNGSVIAAGAGQSGLSSPAFADNAISSLNLLFNNGGAALSNTATITALYNAALATNSAVGSPSNLGSGASLANNLMDQLGIAHAGQCDSSSTSTYCNNSSLTEIDDFWNSSSSIVIGTMPSRCVRDFISASHRLVFDALPVGASAANLYFVLRADPSCRIPTP